MQRISYIDTLKGLLILVVVAHHIPYYALDVYRCENASYSSYMFVREFFYMPFFMTAFFVSTGMSSNFNKPFEDFARGLVRVAIPSYLILRHTHWFIDAFILSKLLYWIINKYITNRYLKLAVVVGMAFLACWLHGDTFYYEAFAWHHAMEMVMFIYIGHHGRKWLTDKRCIILASIVYVVLALFCYFHFHDIPFFEKVFHVSAPTFVPFVILSLSGVMMSIGIAKLIDHALIRFVGRMSLVFYLMHLVILLHLTPLIRGWISAANGNTMVSMAVFVATWVIVVALCLMVAKILDHPKWRWIIGK